MITDFESLITKKLDDVLPLSSSRANDICIHSTSTVRSGIG